MTEQNKKEEADAALLKYWNGMWQSLIYGAYIITNRPSLIYNAMIIFNRANENLEQYYGYKLMSWWYNNPEVKRTWLEYQLAQGY